VRSIWRLICAQKIGLLQFYQECYFLLLIECFWGNVCLMLLIFLHLIEFFNWFCFILDPLMSSLCSYHIRDNLAWKYCRSIDDVPRLRLPLNLRYLFCSAIIRGGLHKFKQHIVGQDQNIRPCDSLSIPAMLLLK
jgi:hypothetical protein